jgi:hypothetical protein
MSKMEPFFNPNTSVIFLGMVIWCFAVMVMVTLSRYNKLERGKGKKLFSCSLCFSFYLPQKIVGNPLLLYLISPPFWFCFFLSYFKPFFYNNKSNVLLQKSFTSCKAILILADVAISQRLHLAFGQFRRLP